jgi:ligand-binding sensor domain-containing protein
MKFSTSLVALIMGGSLVGCTSSLPMVDSITPTPSIEAMVATPTFAPPLIKLPTQIPTKAQPTATAVKASPTNTRVPPTVETAVEFDAKGLLYEYLEGNTPQVVRPLIGEAGVSQIAFNGDGAAWFFTDQGVSRVAKGRIKHFADERIAIEAAFPWTGTQTLWPVAPDGTIWTAADDKLIGYNGKMWSSVSLDGANTDTVDHIAVGPDGLLAITSVSGLSVYTPETGWEVPTLPESAPVDFWPSNDLVAGADGLWIGLDTQGAGGLFRYSPVSQTWMVFDGKNGDLPQNSVTGLAIASNDDLWIANITRGIVAVRRAKSGAWEYLTHESPFPDVYGFGRVYFGIHDDLWLPTIGHCGEEGDPCWLGLAHYANGKWRRYTAADGLASDHVFAVAIDPSGMPWIITDAGLQRFKP